jgi:hypothetical protein
MNPAYVLASALVVFAVAVMVHRATRRMMAARTTKQRTVELPNSHYVAAVTRERDQVARWKHMDLDRVHEINRGEVERLLAKAEALGFDSLRDTEKLFLDNLADVWPDNAAGAPG